ncbi:MAG: response regulator transcription factor [Chitinophagaceae bacterium]|nr:response regulator transcription factor [Chitinophagaceae bacterium]
MNDSLVRIMLVDDHPAVLASWKLLLENNPRYAIVAECSSGECAVSTAPRVKPDIMLLDLNMKPMDGFQVLEHLRQHEPNIKVIGMTVNNLPRYARKLVSMGARGYITKTSGIDEINNGIDQVIRGEFFVCEEVRVKMQPEDLTYLN